MAVIDIESVIKKGVERALNEPIMNGKTVLEWAEIGIHSQEQPQWISVKDRLPEEHESMFYKFLGTPKWSNSMWKQESEKVLVYVSFPDGTGVVTTGCLHNSDWMTTVSKILPQTVTHWMPLPEPPERSNHETINH